MSKNEKFKNRFLINVPPFSGKTYRSQKKLKLVLLYSFILLTRLPAQFILEFITEEEVKERSEHEVGKVVSDAKLDSNQETVDPFFKRGRHNYSVVHHLSQP